MICQLPAFTAKGRRSWKQKWKTRNNLIKLGRVRTYYLGHTGSAARQGSTTKREDMGWDEMDGWVPSLKSDSFSLVKEKGEVGPNRWPEGDGVRQLLGRWASNSHEREIVWWR